MPQGTGGKYLSNLPAQPWVVDPNLFFDLTQRVEDAETVKAFPGFGSNLPIELERSDIYAQLEVTFEGTVAGETANVVAADSEWAYNLVKEFTFSGSGKSDLQRASGMAYHALRFVRNPALKRDTEFFNTSPDENGNFRVAWDIPLAADMTTLIGALWAQSASQTLKLNIKVATAAELGLTGAGVAITGNFRIGRVAFTPPFHPDGSGRLVIPDLTRIHGLVTTDKPPTGTGKTSVPLDDLEAQVMRVLIYTDLGSATGVRNPVLYTATTPAVEKIDFKYGAKQRPLEWEPAWRLAKRNSDHYGSVLPRGWVCIDNVRENAKRDQWWLPGVTDPKIDVHLRPGTALAANPRVEIVQEVQYVSA